MIIAIPEVLREVLGPDGARALAELLNEVSVQTRGDVIEIAASRFERRLAEEIGSVRAEIAGLRADLESQIAGLRADLESHIANLRVEFAADSRALESKIGAIEVRMTRWMFTFWVGQAAIVAGIIIALLRT